VTNFRKGKIFVKFPKSTSTNTHDWTISRTWTKKKVNQTFQLLFFSSLHLWTTNEVTLLHSKFHFFVDWYMKTITWGNNIVIKKNNLITENTTKQHDNLILIS
jgi:hypothetical protein